MASLGTGTVEIRVASVDAAVHTTPKNVSSFGSLPSGCSELARLALQLAVCSRMETATGVELHLFDRPHATTPIAAAGRAF